MNLFVVSDIHGMYRQFELMLTYWDKESTLVILGDMVDRGPRSYDVIRKVMELKRTYGEQVIFCKGNHEEMLLNYINLPEEKKETYYKNGGLQTIESFLNHLPNEIKTLNAIEQASVIQEKFKEELDFLASGKLYAIVGNVLLTHGGFDSSYNDISKTPDNDFLWIREHYLNENLTPYTNVFGHTPLKFIHESHDIWVSEDGKYVGIDGGCYFSGQLNGLVISEKGEIFQVTYVKF